MRRFALILGTVLVVAPAAGCSQVAQFKGVAGGQISAVRAATNDKLVEKAVAVDVAPVCAFEDPYYVCRGTTTDGQAITSKAEVLTEYGASKDQWGAYVPADVSLVITVGGSVIFEGKVEDVIVDNGQVSQ
jgi:hypothetical protein